MEKQRIYPVRADVIITWMDNNNVSKAELARRVKISSRALDNLLGGKGTFERTLTRIGTVMGVKWRSLIKGHEGKPEPLSTDGGIATMTTTSFIIDVDTSGRTDEEALDRLLAKIRNAVKHADRIIIEKKLQGDKNEG